MQEESSKYKDRYTSLPGLTYQRPNCLSECRRQWVLRNCNCSIDFMYPTFRDARDCRMSDFDCIHRISRKFNFKEENRFFRDSRTDESACLCLPACERVDYDADVSSLRLA